MASLVTKAITDALTRVSDGATRSIEAGFHTFQDAEGNFFSVVKNAENGIVKVIRGAETVFEDTERNLFDTLRLLANRTFDTIQIAERGIIRGVARAEEAVIAEVQEIPRLVVNTINETRVDVLKLVDNQLDQIISTVRSIAHGVLQGIHFTILLGGITSVFFMVVAGKEAFREIINSLTTLGGKTIEQVGNVASNVSFIPI